MIASLPLFIYSNCSSSHSVGSNTSQSGVDTAVVLNTLQETSYAIRESKCAGCHNNGTGGTKLTDILNTDFLKQNNFMVPGSPQTSSIYTKVIDGIEPPAGNLGLAPSELNVIRDWIAAEGGKFDTYIGGTPIDTGGGGGGVATFTQVRALLNQNCVACHRAGGQAPRLDVDSNTLRGAGLVIANNAAGSPLLTSFATMPKNAAFGLNSTQANLVRNWINAGALAN